MVEKQVTDKLRYCKKNPNHIKLLSELQSKQINSPLILTIGTMARTKEFVLLKLEGPRYRTLLHPEPVRRYPLRIRHPSPLAIAAAYNRRAAASGSSARTTVMYY